MKKAGKGVLLDFPVVTLAQLGQLLREIRIQRGLTQAQLGEMVGFTQSAISSLESAPQSAKFERLFLVLAALDLEIVLRDRQGNPSLEEW